MRLLALALLLVNLGNDDLVATAKASKEKKKKSTTKVITNADLKKSKGKVVAHAPAPVEASKEKSLAERYETEYRNRIVRDEKLAAAQRKVTELERELNALEQSYYDENDLDKRDTDIVKRFNDTKTRLELARKELAALTPQTTSNQPPTTE
ncbi:MAG TPA: hypothetical protein VJZ00_14695 [Thermoanaerobaculia bacterium]|nr:hypothetical protein [Thermoanaerobaculia bacterium]